MKIHFIGIGGIGLSALARFLSHKGHEISGSDMKLSPITKQLEKEGITIFSPQNAENIKDVDIVIYSAAVTDENPELIEARLRQIRTLSRKEALPIVLGESKNYCVAGAHGKSTTTAILSSILNSSALIGAISKDFDSNFRYIDDLLVFEADESDASFLLSNPYCAVVTNAEPEHMEYYHYDYDKFYAAYESFINIAPKKVLNGEDKDILKLNIEGDVEYLYPSKDIKNLCYMIKDKEPYTGFELKNFGKFEVWGFGFHIAVDASLAILAAINELSLERIRENLKNYRGIKKRFDIVQKSKDFVVIDDYAHHPTEITATMKSVELYDNLTNIDRRVVIWQPHKYSRTSDNLEGFKKCFRRCDELIILPIWTVAGELKIHIDFEKEFAMYNPIFADRINASSGKIELIKDEKIIKTLETGLIIGVGAGDITYQLRG